MTSRRRAVAGGVVALLVLAVSWLEPYLPVDDPAWRRDHDAQISKHAKHYFGAATDWRWFRAQAIVESGLRPAATSRRGAVGLMQLLPSTFREVWRDPALLPDVREPRWNVASGIAYSRHLYDRWRSRVPAAEALPFTLASYNAGFTGVYRARLRARAAGADDTRWLEVAAFAPRETRNYVRRIQRLMGEAG